MEKPRSESALDTGMDSSPAISSQIQTLAIASHFFGKKKAAALTHIMYDLHPVVSHKPAELAQNSYAERVQNSYAERVLTQLACQL